MSEDDAPRGERDASPADAPAAADAGAHTQQRLLEQDLRIQALEHSVEHLRGERAVLLEELRVARPRTGLEAVRWEVKELAKARARRLRHGAPPEPVPAVPLASLPVSPESDVPVWDDAVDILGDVRPALHADPPTCLSWDLDLVAGMAVRGGFALRPGAWLVNRGGVELVAELRAPDGEITSTYVMFLDPTGRASHRKWVPWHFPLPGTGPHRLTLRTCVAEGASLDYAWAVIGDPRIEVPGLAPRPAAGVKSPAAASPADPPSRAAAALRRTRGSERSGAPRGPAISLLLPVHDPAPGLLDRTLASVLGQTSPNWELCIVDDGSSDRLVRDRLARFAAEDSRVRLLRHEQAQNISGATNAALTLATSDFVATLDHDDLLAPDAIEVMSAALADHPEVDLLYSDNDILAGEHRFSAALKPDWSPDLLRSVMYTLHFSVYRRSVIEAIGGWRSAFDGAQDHDLVLRLSEATARIRHVPRVLYHWRAHAGSAALGELAKPLAYDRGRAAIAEHLERTGHGDATVDRLPDAGRYRVRYPRTQPVTVIVPVRGDAADAGLESALRALLAVLRPDDRVLLSALAAAGAGEIDADLGARAVTAIADPRLNQPSASFSKGDRAPLSAAFAVAAGPPGGDLRRVPEGSTVIFMERPVTLASADAIDELAGHVEAGVGAAGGLIAAASGRLVAGAMAFPAGLPVAVQPDADLTAASLHPDLTMVSDRLAVRGVVAVPEALLAHVREDAAGLDRLALVALTAAASERGERVVWSPHARFTASDAAAADLLTSSPTEAVALDRAARPDPFWNPLRWTDRGDATVPEAVHENQLLDVVDE